jgi:hypothetical protein
MPRAKVPDGPTNWQDNPLTRSLGGLLLAQGVYFGLSQVIVLGLIFSGTENRDAWWATASGSFLKQVLQAISILIGSCLVGASQQRGFLQGMVVGLYNSFVFLMIEFASAQGSNVGIEQVWVLFGQPPLQAAFGALGGFIGSMIWKPIRPMGEPTAPKAPSGPTPKLPSWGKTALDGPINWPRVLIGISVAVGVTFWANLIFRSILDNLPPGIGNHAVETPYQAKFVMWEIAVLALVAGGTIAGANSSNGFKQGLIAAFVIAVVLIVLNPRAGGSDLPTQALAFGLLRIDQALNLPIPLANFTYTMLTVVPLVTVGGWFGSQLMPPLTGPHRRVVSDY